MIPITAQLTFDAPATQTIDLLIIFYESTAPPPDGVDVLVTWSRLKILRSSVVMQSKWANMSQTQRFRVIMVRSVLMDLQILFININININNIIYYRINLIRSIIRCN